MDRKFMTELMERRFDFFCREKWVNDVGFEGYGEFLRCYKDFLHEKGLEIIERERGNFLWVIDSGFVDRVRAAFLEE